MRRGYLLGAGPDEGLRIYPPCRWGCRGCKRERNLRAQQGDAVTRFATMPIRTTANNMTIADYSEQLRNRQITINHDYQRSDTVWPISAKSNLIDTILSGYPIPKLILSQTTDLDTRKTRKEVVDGQQRTAAITEFLENKYSLSRGDFAGNRFNDLDDTTKREFLEYSLSADIFTSATDEEIREVFRRINSYQVPLNRQETRHATHQGEFKWFIRDLGKYTRPALERLELWRRNRSAAWPIWNS